MKTEEKQAIFHRKNILKITAAAPVYALWNCKFLIYRKEDLKKEEGWEEAVEDEEIILKWIKNDWNVIDYWGAWGASWWW